jgi:hypothetical protein
MALSFVFVPPQTVMVHTEDVTEVRQAERKRETLLQSEKLRGLGQMAARPEPVAHAGGQLQRTSPDRH